MADRDQEIALHEESLRIRRELGDKRGIAMSLFNLGEGLLDDDFERAEVMIEEGLRLWRELGDKTFVSTRSWISLFRGAYAGSRTGRPARLAKELRRRGERPHYRAARRGRLRPSRSLRQGPPLHAGAEVILAVLGLEEVVGEMSLADSPGRSASVTTLEESVFLWIDRATFRSSVEGSPVLVRNLADVLSRRVRLANAHLLSLAVLDVPGRVASQLLALMREYGEETEEAGVRIPVRLAQSDLAALAGHRG